MCCVRGGDETKESDEIIDTSIYFTSAENLFTIQG